MGGVRLRRARCADGGYSPRHRHGLRRVLDALLPGDCDRDADDGIRTAHSAMYSTYWSRLRPLPHAAELLRACRKASLQVVLASSPIAGVRCAARRSDAEDAIDESTSSGDMDMTKPAPDLVQVALDKAGVPPQQADRGRHGVGRGSAASSPGSVHSSLRSEASAMPSWWTPERSGLRRSQEAPAARRPPLRRCRGSPSAEAGRRRQPSAVSRSSRRWWLHRWRRRYP